MSMIFKITWRIKMKLFFKAGACSLASHIVLAELNMVYQIEAVDLKTKTSASGDYYKINPNGSVPALICEDGSVLTEGPAIMLYLAEQNLEAGLIPKYGTKERVRCHEWLNFISTDIHKNFTPLFTAGMILKNPENQAELKNYYVGLLKKKIAIASDRLAANDYVLGSQFTIADAYLFTVLGWSKHVGLDLAPFANLENYLKRVGDRPSVQKAMKEEGLL